MAKISVQLYTLRSLMEKDFWGTLTGLGQAGFKNVEMAGLGGFTAEEVRAGLAERGMKAHSMHVGFERVRDDMDAVVAEAHTLGCEFVVVPWIDPKKFDRQWIGVAQSMSGLADRLRVHDLWLGYHNHAFEFEHQEGRPGFEIFWENAGENLIAELDLFWVKKGGHDPVDWMKRLAKRLRLAHYKDMDLNGEFTEIGSGTLDWRSIVPASRDVNLDWAVIENDDPKSDPLAAVIQSRNYLLGLGLKD